MVKKEMSPVYYRNTKIVFALYDITNRVLIIRWQLIVQESFEHMKLWIKDAIQKCPNLVPGCVVVLGNKTDLSAKRKISTEEGQEYAEENGYLFYEGSVKTGENILEAAQKAAEQASLLYKEVVVRYT